MNFSNLLKLFLMSLFVMGCSSGHCRKKTPIPGSEVETPSVETGANEKANSTARIFVYKYDGSKQCNMGQPVALDDMQKELTDKGIEVFSASNKPDGLMHIQVCGSATGKANVYEIQKSDQAKAEAQGFKVWTY